MNYWMVLRFLWESKLLIIAPGWAAIGLFAYVQFQIVGLEDSVTDIQRATYEEKLDKAYAALCMNPGDGAILERIRELQQDYEKAAGERYTPPSCDLLFKLR